ncbi:MAG TPA: malto-oligosyltrehalose trehalohydrolase, partial [Opitutus sp.]|nr:malto-oligosyltrehalose trehalohydrolase [Opitutus sp.]
DGAILPDPASRFQPEGVHALSECVDPRVYPWRTHHWRRPKWAGQPIYEVHIGTFTPEGTFLAAIERLEHIAAVGLGAIEIMPVAHFTGERNWGYDGVALYAPARCYGRPDDLRALVDAAHEHGLAVILDVVYNHLGPDGNYLGRFASHYFDAERHTPWGQGFNLSGPDSKPVRDFFVGNACYWFDEFRIDGLRLDATHAIADDSPRHLLAEIADAAHQRGAFLIAEDDRNATEVLHRADGSGLQIDAAWADDFHHQVRVALTGVQESYFKSYRGSPADLAQTLEHGWTYRGQSYPQWKGRPRGEPCQHLAPSAFVYCIENHDQVGNRARGERLEHLISPAAFRAASALLCLSPYAPMIFMGQEWAASTPFMFFTDHAGELGHLVSEGRKKEFATAGLNQGIAPEEVPDPQAPETFLGSKLRWDELRQYPHATICELYRTCLQHRAKWLQPLANDRTRWSVASFEHAIAIRYAGEDQPERLVVSALQGDTRVSLLKENFLLPPAGSAWHVEFESNAGVPGAGAVAGAVRSTAERRAVDALVFDAPATVLLVAQPSGRRDA